MVKFIYTIFLLMPVIGQVFASECVVSSGGGFIAKIASIADSGACKTSGKDYRERYEKYRGTSGDFHVIRFDTSADIDSPVPCLTGYGGDPLIIIADPEIRVTIEQSVCIGGKGGRVIADGIRFNGGLRVSSSESAVIGSKISRLNIGGDSNYIVSSEVTKGGDISGSKNKVIKSSIHGAEGYGIYISGSENKILQSKIYKNEKGGIFVKTCGNDGCKDPRTALVSRTEFWKNGGGQVDVEKNLLPVPTNLVGVSTASEWKVTGNLVGTDELPPLNLEATKVELFIKDGPFVAETDEIDFKTGLFIFSLPRPLKIGGKEYDSPVFTASLVDYEGINTSPFSVPLDSATQDDWDGDGILNDDEDYNHNGVADFGETDPRNKDTDGDGLTDGEERLHTGRVKELMDKGSIADLSRLDPVNPDSDGDCLKDGLEAGVGGLESPTDAVSSMKILVETLSPYCKAILKSHNLLAGGNFDSDPLTVTDPTNADTDFDGLADGVEDWNFDGRRDNTAQLETDPNLPDSDDDTLLDGAEGDSNNNGQLDENETDPLLTDTDGDGAADNIEIKQLGSLPNSCDSDKDGLSDGIESGSINPNPKNPECAGLQTAGTNFASIGILDPVKEDSDGDGLADGAEDINHNGWLDIGETDPTTSDTDSDGISDYAETMLDLDRDGFPDIVKELLKNGAKCSPPMEESDLDCDGVINARDDDSDGDGCLDRDEGMYADNDTNGIPDVWEQVQASCGTNSGGGLSGGGAPPQTPAEKPAPAISYHTQRPQNHPPKNSLNVRPPTCLLMFPAGDAQCRWPKRSL